MRSLINLEINEEQLKKSVQSVKEKILLSLPWPR